MALFGFRALLILLIFAHNPWAQITFNSPMSGGTSCSTTVTSAGLRLDCTGRGYITADKLLDGSVNTYMYVTVLSADVPAGVGLGQRTDTTCLASMFPEAGTTWYDCQSCSKYYCYYNEVTTFTSSSYATVSPYQTIKIGKRYNWQIVPATSSGKCWKINIASESIFS